MTLIIAGLLVFVSILLFSAAPNWIRRTTLAILQKQQRPR